MALGYTPGIYSDYALRFRFSSFCVQLFQNLMRPWYSNSSISFTPELPDH